MRVVGIISSAHTKGNSATLLREALAGAREAGAETEEIVLSEFDLRYCLGCMRCNETGCCCQPDDFEVVRRRLRDANAIVLSSPTYGAAPCARMKNLFDRLGLFEYMTSSTFGGKYVAAIATAKAFGAKATAGYLASVPLGTVFERAYVSGTLPAILRGGKRADEFPDYMRRARALGARVVADLRGKRRYPLQNLRARLINRLMMRPLMARGIASLKDSSMRGVYESLAERGLIG